MRSATLFAVALAARLRCARIANARQARAAASSRSCLRLPTTSTRSVPGAQLVGRLGVHRRPARRRRCRALPTRPASTSRRSSRCAPSVVVGIPAQARFAEPLRARRRARRAARRRHLRADLRKPRGDRRAHRPRAASRRPDRAPAARNRGTARREPHASHRIRASSSCLAAAPIWTAGARSYIATLIALAGGTNAAADLHAAYGAVQRRGAAARSARRARRRSRPRSSTRALDREPWRSLRAVRAHHVYARRFRSARAAGPTLQRRDPLAAGDRLAPHRRERRR